jgi:hypothetical protein
MEDIPRLAPGPPVQDLTGKNIDRDIMTAEPVGPVFTNMENRTAAFTTIFQVKEGQNNGKHHRNRLDRQDV